MGKSLEEYAAEHPQQEPETERQSMAAVVQDYQTRQELIAEVTRLKTSIKQQIEEGNAPEYILYTALKVIGLLTNDMEWAKAGQDILDLVYSDLAQQSFLTDNAAIAADRQEKMRQEYSDKLKRQLKRNLNGYKKVADSLQAALKALEAIDQPEA